jgi:Ca2+-binding RTX toxin-like protein
MFFVVLVLPPAAVHASIDATRDAAGSVYVTATGDAAEQVTLFQDGTATIRITDAAGPVGSSDGSCTVDATSGAATCPAASGAYVFVALGAGDDTLDARDARQVALTVDGGSGADTLQVGAGRMTRINDTTATDVIDLSHADDDVVVRWQASRTRVVATCTGCETSWTVVLPARPGTVRTGDASDDVDLRTWRAGGTTAWQLGAGADRWFGSPVHRAIVDGGADADSLVSYAPVDTLLGGAGTDKIADFGGRGDVLRGGADGDVMASLDGQRDVFDGGASRDMCLTIGGRTTRQCDTGSVTGFEMSRLMPRTTPGWVLPMLGIR